MGTRGLFIDPEGARLADFLDLHEQDDILDALLTPALGIIHPAAMIRRDVMRQMGGYRDDSWRVAAHALYRSIRGESRHRSAPGPQR